MTSSTDLASILHPIPHYLLMLAAEPGETLSAKNALTFGYSMPIESAFLSTVSAKLMITMGPAQLASPDTI